MPKGKSKVVKYTITYDDRGNVKSLKIKNKVELTKKETNQIIAMDKLKYPLVIELVKSLNEKTIEDKEEFFEEYSRFSFFRGQKIININGKKYTKEEYLDEVKRENKEASKKEVSLDGEITFYRVNYGKKEEIPKELSNQIKKMPKLTYDDEGNVSLSRPLKFSTYSYELPGENYNEASNSEEDFGLLGKRKKKRRK